MRLILLLLLLCPISGLFAESDPARARLLSIAIAEDERRLNADSLTAWSSDTDPRVRQRTAYAIGIAGDTTHAALLKRLLQDMERVVSIEAIFAAGQLATSALLEDLAQLLGSSDEATRARCVDALAKIGGDSAAALICRTALSEKESVAVRAIAARSLFRLKDSTSAQALISLTASPDSSLKEAAYYGLARRKIDGAGSALRAGLESTNQNIQCFAADGLARLADSAVAETLIAGAINRPWRVQYHAIEAAVRLGMNATPQQFSGGTSHFENPYVQAAVLRTFSPGGESVPQLDAMKSLLESEIAAVATEALLAETRLTEGKNWFSLERFIASPDASHRQAAARACGIVRSNRARAALTGLFNDPVPAVRGEALEQMFEFSDSILTDTRLHQALEDPDLIPVAIACSKIAEDSLTKFVPQLAARFPSASSDDIRESILDALIQLSGNADTSALLQPVCELARASESFFVREKGRVLARKVGLSGDSGTDHFVSLISDANFDEVYEPPQRRPHVAIETSRGTIEIELNVDAAPKTVYNFLKLVRSGFYENRVWHRVVPDFVIQDGCPRGDGWGGPGYAIRCEYNALPYVAGSVGMATSGKDTGGSQYFICQSAQPHLDGRYTLFGQVVSGMEIVLQMQQGDKVIAVRELRK